MTIRRIRWRRGSLRSNTASIRKRCGCSPAVKSGWRAMSARPAALIPAMSWFRLREPGASVGGPDYPSLTTAILALDRIDFATGLQRLLYRRKAGALACRTFLLGRFHGWLSHFGTVQARAPVGHYGSTTTLQLSQWKLGP